MTLTSNSLDQLPHTIAMIGTESFPNALLDFIRGTAPFDSAVIMAYPESGSLRVLHNALHEGDQKGFSGPYRDGLWLLSPTYLKAKSGLRGFFRLMELAPDDFRDSDYYALYYDSSGVIDHTLFLLESGDATPIAISLERTERMRPFSKRELAQLTGTCQLVASLVKQHWKSDLDQGKRTEATLHQQVETVLQQFGCSILTPRELEVVQLVLKGYPSKLAAKTLGISGQTEQVHRKHIYQKLGLSSHSELFSLFFDALAQPSNDGSDPLVALLK
ncbi:MAG: LuxR C-terminal-related transcriptional regulator [Halioglobus sp.]